MADDKEIARRALDFRARAKDYRLMDIPGYMEWSKRQLREGVSEALIAHLDATAMTLLPEELSTVAPETFDEMLEDLRRELGDALSSSDDAA
jgi:hypothetical protein